MTMIGITHSCPVASPSSENRSAALPSFGSIVRNPTVSPPTMAKKITPSTLRIAFRVVIGACTSCRETLSKQVAVAFRSHETCAHFKEKACAFRRKSAVAIPSMSRGGRTAFNGPPRNSNVPLYLFNRTRARSEPSVLLRSNPPTQFAASVRRFSTLPSTCMVPEEMISAGF